MTQRTPFDPTEPTQPSTSIHSMDVLTDRRGVLAAAVVVVGAGALAACSSPPVPTQTAASSASSVSSTPSTQAATSTTSDAATTGVETPAPAGTATSEIPVGGGKIYADQKVVVTQPTAGQFKAFSAVCTHQQCIVGQIEDGAIICPCHNSHFDISTGSPTPDSEAKSPLEARSITVTGATFTVS